MPAHPRKSTAEFARQEAEPRMTTNPSNAADIGARIDDPVDARASAPAVPAKRLDLAFGTRPLLVALLVMDVGLVVAGVAANLAYQVNPEGVGGTILLRFLLDWEGSIPTWYSASLLGLCAVALTAIGLAAGTAHGRRVRWLMFAAVFAALSLDEIIQVHEQLLRNPTIDQIKLVPLAVVAALSAIVCLPLLRDEPPRLRLAWVLAGILYVGGALGVESLSQAYQPPETSTLSYILLVGLEEGMEMTGATVFAVALLTTFADRSGRVRLTLGEPVR
jgi:hypothetical protein